MNPDHVDAFTRPVVINPATTALVPIDLQYASGSREHGLGALLARQGRLQQASARIVHGAIGSAPPDFSDAPPSTAASFRATKNHAGTREHEIVDVLKPLPGEPVLVKRIMGAFASTNNCVDMTAREASDRGFGAVLVSDATGTCSDAMQDAALATFKRLWGRVADTDTILAELAGAARTPAPRSRAAG